MSTNERERVSTTLEALIDKHGLPFVLEELAKVCEAKADHIRTNWQDNNLSAAWTKLAVSTDFVATLAEKLLPWHKRKGRPT
jgi:hypothetical protein